MARIIYSALVDSIRGSIQGTTFQRNAYGHTVKGKPNMVNPNTTRQNARKRTFSAAAQAWRDLTSGQRSAWDAYANAFPIPSRQNPSAYLSGLAAFTRWHAVRFLSNTVVLTSPAGAQGTAVVSQQEAVLSAGQLHVLLDIATTNGPWIAFVYLSRPLQPTQAFIKSWQRYIVSATSATWADFDISAAYVAVFGALPVLTNLLGMQVVMLNTTNGQVLFGAPQIVTVTV
jgi:hypothetical protein